MSQDDDRVKKSLQYQFDKLKEDVMNHFRVDVECRASTRNDALRARLTYLTNAHYVPAPLVFNRHMQSVFNITNSRTDEIEDYERELVRMSDGGQFSLDWAHETSVPSSHAPRQKIMFIVHGLTGGSNMNYIKSLIIYARRHGYKCVAFNSRGINTEMTHHPYPFNGGDLSELDTALRLVHDRYPDAALFAIGASYGGNMVLRWAADQGDKCFLAGFVGLAAPFDINQCLTDMGFLYEQFFVNRYKANVITPHLETLRQLEALHNVDLNEVMLARSLRKFHESITVKVFNYESVEHVFAVSNVSRAQIGAVRVPTLLMYARDDPIVSIACVPKDAILENDAYILASTAYGAHVCWFEGVWPPRRWYPKPVIQYCDAVLEVTRA